MLGVLVEKAKTTPENYPLSLNALKNGCNQKNNRAPLMQVEEDQVDAALEYAASRWAPSRRFKAADGSTSIGIWRTSGWASKRSRWR